MPIESYRDLEEFLQFLRRANGSLVEVEPRLVLSADLEFSTQQEAEGTLKQTQILGKKILIQERGLERHRGKQSPDAASGFAIRCSQRPATRPAAAVTS